MDNILIVVLVSIVSMLLGVFGLLQYQSRKRRLAIDVGLSATAKYQLYKEQKLELKSRPAPDSLTPVEVERFDKLSPLHQHQFVAARKQIGLDG